MSALISEKSQIFTAAAAVTGTPSADNASTVRAICPCFFLDSTAMSE